MQVKIPGSTEDVEMTPFFTHDCTECVYLGSATINTVNMDFYYHAHDGYQAPFALDLVVRFSSEPCDYSCTHPEYATPFTLHGSLCFAMYLRHKNAMGSNLTMKGRVVDGAQELIIHLS